MLINLQVGKSSVEARVNYLLHGVNGERDPNAVHILDGDPELFKEVARHNPYKTKTYNFLISFAESKEELERKLAQQGKTIEELYEEILSFLLPAEYYPREALNILAVGHSDTDNFHIHLTIENYDHLSHKSLYLPKNKTELQFFRVLETYFKVKYSLSFGVSNPFNKGRAGVKKIKQILEGRGEYREKTRNEVKEELTNFLIALIQSGEIESREDLIAYLSSIEGVELHRIGKSYISIRLEGDKRSIRLKGGIYDEERFREFKEHIQTGKREIPTLKEARELLERVRQKREKCISQRRPKHNLERLESVDLGNDRELSFLNRELSNKDRENLVDRAFSLDWASIIDRVGRFQERESPEGFSSLLRDEKRRERGTLEDLQSSGGELVSRFRKVEALQSDSYPSMKIREVEAVRRDINEIRALELEYLKNIDPATLLPALGITDWQEKNGYLLLKSPLREEDNPSFEVFYGTERGCWIYVDFGIGWKGSSIDLWQAVRGVDYITAVREMREEFGINLLEEETNLKKQKEAILKRIEEERRRQAEKRERLAKSVKEELSKVSHRILDVRAPQHSALLKYLKDRGIRELPDWVKEIRYLYLPKKKYYFALGVQDINGVWHTRNPYGKANLITSPTQRPTYSLIKNGSRKVVVVEGLFDALTFYQLKGNDYDVVILNSVVNTERLIKDGILSRYKVVLLALDNDEAGKKAEEQLLEHLSKIELKIGKLEYSRGKDLNENLINGGKLKIKDLTPKRFWIGKIKDGTVYRTVISDNREVLLKLKASGIRRIASPKDIAEFWEQEKCRGYVELYIREEAPDWIEDGLKKAVWYEAREYNFLPSDFEEVRPTRIYKVKYDLKDGELLLQGGDIERPAEERKIPLKKGKERGTGLSPSP